MTIEDSADKRRSASPSGGDHKRRKGFVSSEGHDVNSKEIFVSNIPFDLTWQIFKDQVKDVVGEVGHVKLYNNEQGKPRGCGTVTFANTESVKIALEKLQNYEIKGRKIKVNEAFSEPRDEYGYLLNAKGMRKKDVEKRGFGVKDSRYNDSSRPIFSSAKAQNEQTSRGEDFGLDPNFLSQMGIQGDLTNRIWVSNLDEERVDERKLRDVFGVAGRVTMVMLSRTREGKSKGHAIIEYNHPLEAVQAITMLNNASINGKKVYVRLDRVGERNPRNQFGNRLPDGVTNLGMGLGQGGIPLQNISERFNNQSTTGTEKMAEELKEAKDKFDLLRNQLIAVGGISGFLKLSQMMESASKTSASNFNNWSHMMKEEDKKPELEQKTDQDQLLALLSKAKNFTATSAKSMYEQVLSRDYDHKSSSLGLKNPLNDPYSSYSSKWF